jgi:hypothetical protein
LDLDKFRKHHEHNFSLTTNDLNVKNDELGFGRARLLEEHDMLEKESIALVSKIFILPMSHD